MHDQAHTPERPVPRLVLRAILGLLIFTVVAITAGRMTETGLMLSETGTMAEQRPLVFEHARDGSITVRDHDTGRMVALLPPDEDGFIRGVLRALERGRAVNRVEGEAVFLITRWEDGRVSLSDPATGERFDLNSFGIDNLNAVVRLLPSREGTQ